MNCMACGSTLGLDCGDAEPDYDENFCSEGCYKSQWYENEIVSLISERLELGYNKYKKTMPIDDGRDWVQESLEEILDCCVYVANKLILLKKQKN